MSIKVLLVNDHEIVRYGLRCLIEEQPDMEVVGEAENGRMAIDLAQRLKPNVVIMDISMPSAWQWTAWITSTYSVHQVEPPAN